MNYTFWKLVFALLLMAKVLCGCQEKKQFKTTNFVQKILERKKVGLHKQEIKNKKQDFNIPADTVDYSELFLNSFSDLDFKNLQVYSPEVGSANRVTKFAGKPLDSIFSKFLIIKDSNRFLNASTCYKYSFNSRIMGLILRNQGRYVDSALSLLIWDIKSKKVIEVIELADEWGDGGWYFVQNAWFQDINQDEFLDIVIRNSDFDVFTGKWKCIRDTTFVYLGEQGGFKRSAINIHNYEYKLIKKY